MNVQDFINYLTENFESLTTVSVNDCNIEVQVCDEDTISFEYRGILHEVFFDEVEESFTEIFGEFDEIVLL